MLVNLKWLENYQLAIKLEKHILDLETLMIKKVILMLLMKDMMLKMLFSMVIFMN